MATSHKPYTIIISQRNSANTSFEEVLLSGSNLILQTDASGNLIGGSSPPLPSGSFTLTTGSLYPITSSWALTSSFALNASSGGTSITTGSRYPITSSWAITSSNSITASFALNALSGGTTLNTGSLYPITSSWSLTALTASYINIIPSGSTESASYSTTASHALEADYIINSGLSIPRYDYSELEYNGPLNQFSKCTYKINGISGSTVCILTANYSGSLFIGVNKILG